jgi:hypothetical protein
MEVEEMARISYIKVCKNCEHYELYKGKDKCPVLGKRQLTNVANGCEYFKGEKYAFNHDRAHTIGERPSTFSR